MLTVIPDLLSAAQVSELRALIDAAEWIDGNATSGAQSALAKRNAQLPEDSAVAQRAGAGELRPGLRGRAAITTDRHPLVWILGHRLWDWIVTTVLW